MARPDGVNNAPPVPATIVIVVTPAARPVGAFHAWLRGRLICTSPTPFYESARRLLREGASPAAVLIMRHRGDTHDALRSTVGTAARYTVEANKHGGLRLRLYRPPEGGRASPVACRPSGAHPERGKFNAAVPA
jgi:hypothetical protein